MNIGIVTTWFERGAAYVSRQYQSILGLEHNVYIYARGGQAYAVNDPTWDQTNVTWGKKLLYGKVTAVDTKDFSRWLSSKHIDVVLFNEQHTWPPVILCNKLGIITGAYIDYYTEETVPFFGCYDFLICNTKRHHSVFTWHPNSWYIPWGTDVSLFVPTNAPAPTSGAVRFFHSAGMNPARKGTDLLIQAFAAIDFPCLLIIHMQGQLAAGLPQMASLIEELKAQERLIVIEKTVPAPGLYYMGDVYVYPTRLEGIGLSVPEALACGLPVVTTNAAPMSEFVKGGANGRLIDVERYVACVDGYYWPQSLICLESLRQQLLFYINDSAHLLDHKRSARNYAEEYLDWSKNALPLLALLSKVTKRSGTEVEDAQQQALAFDRLHTSIRERYPRTSFFLDLIHKAFPGRLETNNP